MWHQVSPRLKPYDGREQGRTGRRTTSRKKGAKCVRVLSDRMQLGVGDVRVYLDLLCYFPYLVYADAACVVRQGKVTCKEQGVMYSFIPTSPAHV